MSRRHNRGEYNRSGTNPIFIIITIVLAIAFVGLLYSEHRQEQAREVERSILVAQEREERLAQEAKELAQREESLAQEAKEQAEKEAARAEKMEMDSFYQKLADGLDVNILIVGDSIGAGAGADNSDGINHAWFNQLSHYLQTTYLENEDYTGQINVTNVSMGGNSSYAGYVRIMALDDGVDYDLAILCYGQNDGMYGFSTNYESIIRAIQEKYIDCSIIAILESSQREYTVKMVEIKNICAHYNIPIADTIAAFNKHNYDELTKDGVHPNNAGQDIYFETVKAVIDSNVDAFIGKPNKVSPLNDDVRKFDNFVWYGSEIFTRESDTTYTIQLSASGILGIDYTYLSSDNKMDIYVDGILFQSRNVTFDHDFSQRHILVVSENCTVKTEIRIEFADKDQADGFKGICFSWE